MLLLALAAPAFGGLAGARSREKPPGFPVLYAPPDGIGPAQAKYIYSETVDRETYVATLMYAAEKEAVDLTRDGDTWTIKDRNGPAGWAGLDPVTLGTAHILGGPGRVVHGEQEGRRGRAAARDEIALFDNSVETWAKSLRQPGHQRARGLGGLLVLAGFAAVLACAIWNPFSMTMLGLIPGAFAVCGTLADGDRLRHQAHPRRP